jgi:hypothetical protein
MYRRYSHFIPNHQPPVRLGAAFINPDFAAPDHAVNAGPGHTLQPRQKEIIEAPVSIIEIDGDRSRSGTLYRVFHNLKGLKPVVPD